MAAELCNNKLAANEKLLHFYGNFMIAFCVLNLVLSLVAALGNYVVIRALSKASSIPGTLKKLFLNLAVSDFAVGLFAQLMLGIIIAVMLNMAASGNYNFDVLCPNILTVCFFVIYLLTCASFLAIIVIISVDRFLAVFLHLRYQELVTPKSVLIALLSLWLISIAAASMYIILPTQNNMLVVTIEFVGLLVTTVGYIRIYKVVRYHQNQIQNQFQLQDNHKVELLREKKSTINALFLYMVFVACFVPNLCCIILRSADGRRLSFLAANHVSDFLVLFNSTLNPIIYCWRYREIREIVKAFVKKLFVAEDRLSDGLQL